MPMFGKKKKDKKGKSESTEVEDKDDESPLEITDSDENNDDDDFDDDDESSDDDDDDSPGGSLIDDDDDDPMDSDLMDIFSGEAEEVDIDLAALMEGLQPVEAIDILAQAKGVLAALRLMRAS